MKNLFLTSTVLLLMTSLLRAQVNLPQQEGSASVKQADNIKTMDRQQVIVNYLQMVAGNLTNDTKTVQLKANLFALNPKDSATKYASSYYLAHAFQRNTQLLLGSALDKNSAINGFTAGFSVNILNQRDPTEYHVYQQLDGNVRRQIGVLVQQKTEQYQQISQKALVRKFVRLAKIYYDRRAVAGLHDDILGLIALPGIAVDFPDDPTFKNFDAAFEQDVAKAIQSGLFDLRPDNHNSALYILTDYLTTTCFLMTLNSELTAYVYYIDQNGEEPKQMSADLSALVKSINATIPADGTLSPLGKDMLSVYTSLHQEYQKAVERIAKKPLLALGYNYTYATAGVSYIHNISAQFLMGLGKNQDARSWEMSITAADSLMTDTAAQGKPVNRQLLSLQAGFNKILFTDKSAVSLLEIKPALEMDHVFKGSELNGKATQFYASVTLQGRPSAKSPWFKLIAKYNKDAKFLGFLAVTLNLDNSANKSN